MKSPGDPVGMAVRQYRRLTAVEANGAATRTRVLARADQRRQWRGGLRSMPALVVFAIVAAGSVALAAAQVARWTRPPALVLPATALPTEAPGARIDLRPRRVIPVLPPAPLGEAAPADGEGRWYGAAHAQHFSVHDPRGALAAWNAYLRQYPHGAFEPEARFNRAVCLVRLRQLEQAAAALEPFVAGRFGAYRREEAQRLLDWVRDAAPSAAAGR